MCTLLWGRLEDVATGYICALFSDGLKAPTSYAYVFLSGVLRSIHGKHGLFVRGSGCNEDM